MDEQSQQRWEKDLEDQMISQKSRFSFSWSFLNQPFFLWMLSTIAVGILTFSFTSYSSCKADLQTDRERLSRILTEVGFRKIQVSFRFPKILSEDDIDQARQVIDPDRNFAFKTFKGVRTEELRWEISNIAEKWELVDEKFSSNLSHPIVPINVISKSVGALVTVETLVRSYGKNNLQLFGRAELAVLQGYIKDLSDAAGMSPDYWKAGWISPNVCASRAIWPFYKSKVSE